MIKNIKYIKAALNQVNRRGLDEIIAKLRICTDNQINRECKFSHDTAHTNTIQYNAAVIQMIKLKSKHRLKKPSLLLIISGKIGLLHLHLL